MKTIEKRNIDSFRMDMVRTIMNTDSVQFIDAINRAIKREQKRAAKIANAEGEDLSNYTLAQLQRRLADEESKIENGYDKGKTNAEVMDELKHDFSWITE